MASALLARAEWRARRARHLTVASSLAVGLVAALLLAMLLAGAKEGVLVPLEATTTGELRITRGSTELASGHAWSDARAAQLDLARTSGGDVSWRWESSHVTVRTDGTDAWAGGLLLGIEPTDERERDALVPYLVWGHHLAGQDAFHPVTGRAYVPLLVGDTAAERLNVTLDASGEPRWNETLYVTSGRFDGGSNQAPRHVEAIVVGVFDTGLDPLDRFTLYMPIQAARDLAGHGQNAPTANALVLRDGDVAAGKAWARDNGYDSATAKAFGKQYFGGILIVLDAVAIAASAAVLLVLALWILHDTAVVVGADRTMLAALRAVGVPLRSLVAAYMAPAAITALLGAAIAVLVAVVWSLAAPPLHLDAPGLGAELAWTLQPVQLLGPAAAVVLASAAAGLAARHIGRLDPAEALRPR